MIAPLLAALGSARRAKVWLEEEIKRVEEPHKAAAEAASAHLRAALDRANSKIDEANDAARAVYTAAVRDRRAKLREGIFVPAIQLPEGWSASERPTVEIIEPGSIPREFCQPDKKAVTEAIKAGVEVPGAKAGAQLVFTFKAPKSAD